MSPKKTFRFSDVLRTITDRDLFGVNTTKRWMTNSGCIAQALGTSNDQEHVATVKPEAIGQRL